MASCKRVLVALGLWLARVGGWSEADCFPGLTPLITHARNLCLIAESTSAAGTSGEWKRHHVYAAMQKAFPDAPKQDVALAIELALR